MSADSPFPLNTHDYALIDPVAPQRAHGADWPLLPLAPAALAAESDSLPALLPLATLGPDQRAGLANALDRLATGESSSLCALLRCEAAPDTLARHLAARLIVEAPQGRALLRYYDPRVFPHLERILSPAQRAALFGPIRVWTLCSPPAPRSVARPDTATGPQWRLTRVQREALDRVAAVNALLRAHHALSGASAPAQAADEALLAATRRLPDARPDDLHAYALHQLAHGASFAAHPLIAQVLASLDTERGYADAASLITPATWLEIDHDLRHQALLTPAP